MQLSTHCCTCPSSLSWPSHKTQLTAGGRRQTTRLQMFKCSVCPNKQQLIWWNLSIVPGTCYDNFTYFLFFGGHTLTKKEILPFVLNGPYELMQHYFNPRVCIRSIIMGLTLDPPGFAIYLKQPMDKIYPLLECTDFQESMLNNNVV